MNRKILFFNKYFIFFYAILNLIIYWFLLYLSDNIVWRIVSLLVVVMLFYSPIITYKNKNYFLAIVGYLWMGFVIYFLMFILIVCSIKIFLNEFYPKDIIVLSSLLATALVVFSFLNVNDIQIKTLEIKNSKLGSFKKPLVITHLTDIHWGLFIRNRELNNIVNLTNKLNSDILIMSGDIIDAQGVISKELLENLKNLRANLVKLIVFGNHEYFFNKAELNKVFEGSNIKILFNEVVDVNEIIQVIGLDYYNTNNLKSIKEKTDISKFKILVTHKATINKESLKLFDLQLSGHTHGGQFFPITILTKMIFDYNYGIYKFNEDKILYVSSGTGTWLPPLRFLTRPEIVVFKINPSEA